MSFFIATSVDWEHVAEFLSICKLSPYVVICCNYGHVNMCMPSNLPCWIHKHNQATLANETAANDLGQIGSKEKASGNKWPKETKTISPINWQVDKKNTNQTFHHNPRWPFSKKLGILWYARRKRPKISYDLDQLDLLADDFPQKDSTGKDR